MERKILQVIPNSLTGLFNSISLNGFAVNPCPQDTLFLTLDDGPNPETQSLMNWMEAEGISATHFWVMENLEKFPVSFPDVTLQNIGTHGFRHIRYSSLNWQEIEKDLGLCKNSPFSAHPLKTNWFRTPYGSWKPGLRKRIRRYGFRPVWWGYLFQDWTNNFSPAEIGRTQENWAKPGQILVMHDKLIYQNRLKTALLEVKQICQKKGIRISCLP